MSVNYTYEIINVNEEARCMEIIYSAVGHSTQHIGARLPYEGETTEQIIRMYSPVAYWLEKQKNVIAPEVGTAGIVNAADEEAQILAEIAARLEEARVQQQPTIEGAQDL